MGAGTSWEWQWEAWSGVRRGIRCGPKTSCAFELGQVVLMFGVLLLATAAGFVVPAAWHVAMLPISCRRLDSHCT